MQRSQLSRFVLACTILISLLLQSCRGTTSSFKLVRDDSASMIEDKGLDGEQVTNEELEDTEDEPFFWENLRRDTTEEEPFGKIPLVEKAEVTKLEKKGGKRSYPKRERNSPQWFRDSPQQMEMQRKKQDFSTAEEDLEEADPRYWVGGNGIIGGYKLETVIRFPEVNMEDYFSRKLYKRIIQGSIDLRREKQQATSVTERGAITEKHGKHAVDGSPSPNGKNIKPVNVRLKIVNDPDRIISLHVYGDIAAIFHKKGKKEQGLSSYEKLAKRFAKILKSQEDREKVVALVWLAVVEKKDIQKEYDQLADAWKDYLLDFMGVQVAEIVRAHFHAQEDEGHLQFNLAAIYNALKELKTKDFTEVYVRNNKKFAPFAGEGGASFYRESFFESTPITSTPITTPQRKSKRRKLFPEFSSSIKQISLPELE